VDPVCHTLVGASLGFTGLEKRARFGRTTMILGANMPDLDAVTYWMAPMVSLQYRRGITHGVLALVVLPLLLAAFMKLVDHFWPRTKSSPACRYPQLLLLSAIAIATHPVLDFLNNYGMRWLMPFVDKWWYGDTLFIIDPIVWSVLLLGLIATWFTNPALLRPMARPASIALLVVTVYIIASATGTAISSRTAYRALELESPQRLMSSPIQLSPFERFIVVDNGDEYLLGSVDLLRGPAFSLYPRRIPKGEDHPAVAVAAANPGARIFLHWARFPYFEVEETAASTIVYIMDARYETRRSAGFGSFRIELPKTSP
jgi:inner membrane protein